MVAGMCPKVTKGLSCDDLYGGQCEECGARGACENPLAKLEGDN